MKKLLITTAILLFTISETFAYAVKVYDEIGNRLGTYRKEGDNFVLYDFYDKKVENPEDLIKNAPTKQTLTNMSQYFYDENLTPIGSFSTGLWNNYGRNYRRGYGYMPYGYYNNRNHNYIVRPGARPLIPPPPPPRRTRAFSDGTHINVTDYSFSNYSLIPKHKL